MIFQEKLQVPYKFVIEKMYGKESKKGVWDGIMGALVNRSVDLAIAPLVITPKRAKAVDFSHPFLHSGVSLMMLKPLKYRPVLSLILFIDDQ